MADKCYYLKSRIIRLFIFSMDFSINELIRSVYLTGSLIFKPAISRTLSYRIWHIHQCCLPYQIQLTEPVIENSIIFYILELVYCRWGHLCLVYQMMAIRLHNNRLYLLYYPDLHYR